MNRRLMECFADVIGFKNSKNRENGHRKRVLQPSALKMEEDWSCRRKQHAGRIASSCWIDHAKSPLVASCECETDSSRLAEPLQCFTENNEMESITDDFMVIVAITYNKTKLKDMFPWSICHSFLCDVKNGHSFCLVTLIQRCFAAWYQRDHISLRKKTPPIYTIMMVKRAFEWQQTSIHWSASSCNSVIYRELD